MTTQPLSSMITPVTALSRLVEARVQARGLSNRQVADLSQHCPIGTVSQGTVGQYRTGRHPDSPSDKVLRVLSWTLNIPLRDLQRAAGVKETRGPWVPPPEAHQMTRRQRAVVEEIIKLLAARADTGNPGDDDAIVTYGGTRDICEEAPPMREPSAEERDATRRSRTDAPRENGPQST